MKTLTCTTSRSLLIIGVALALLAPAAAAAPRPHATATWAVGTLPGDPIDLYGPEYKNGFKNQTIRQLLPASIGGTRVTLRLTNAFGKRPLRLEHVTLAVPTGDGGIDPATITPVTFSGRNSVTVASGERAVSDPVDYRLRVGAPVAMTFYAPGATGPPTFHREANQRTFISPDGDHVRDPTAAAFPRVVKSLFFVDGLSVVTRQASSSVITLGDSITDGVGTTTDRNTSWPAALSRRVLRAHRTGSPFTSVVNAGIGSNRVLNNSIAGGPSALSRFRRDVLAQDGVRDVIVLEGINDIGFGSKLNGVPQVLRDAFAPLTAVSVKQIITGYDALIKRAHAAGLRVLGGTLTPFRGAFTYTAAGEAKRKAVNDWIRNRSDFDGVIDFDAVVRDPSRPQQQRAAYGAGDSIHFNDAGYAAMGRAVRLSCLSLGDRRLPVGRRANCTT